MSDRRHNYTGKSVCIDACVLPFVPCSALMHVRRAALQTFVDIFFPFALYNSAYPARSFSWPCLANHRFTDFSAVFQRPYNHKHGSNNLLASSSDCSWLILSISTITYLIMSVHHIMSTCGITSCQHAALHHANMRHTIMSTCILTSCQHAALHHVDTRHYIMSDPSYSPCDDKRARRQLAESCWF